MMEVLAVFLAPIVWLIAVMLVFHPFLKGISGIIRFIREITSE